MEVRFPRGMRVDVLRGDLHIQPAAGRRAGSAPSPFDLFMASIGTCVAIYALRFLQERQLDTSGLSVSLTPEWNVGKRLVSRIRIEIALPESFPVKYREEILRAVDQCTVRRHLAQAFGGRGPR